MSAPTSGQVRDLAATFSLGVVIVFATAILAWPGPGFILHEVAGLLLLVGILTALAAAMRRRRVEPRPVPRLAAALAVLVAVGGSGAALAIGALPRGLSALPLAGLVVLAGLLADSLRVGRPPRGPRD